ncbi:hypothetical protein [Streptomyces sp. NPDC095613]|uniref:hypothetical protein n=1 Tax=Streptomyces sp. NPDC095613 TaxID=3155540 RepID=UPI00332B62B0
MPKPANGNARGFATIPNGRSIATQIMAEERTVGAAYYGTHPEVLSRLLSDLTPEERRRVRHLDPAENACVEERSLNRYPQTGGRLEFPDDSVVERRKADTEVEAADLLAKWVNTHIDPETEVVAMWGNYVVPSLAMPSKVLADHAGAVVASSSDVWVYADRESLIIERFHDGRTTLARVG